MSNEDYLKLNKALWNDRVAVHLESDFYRMNDFLGGENSLKSIELDLLGDVRDKKILHLQCHFGQDSLSLSRLGAKVTGVDFASEAIHKAKELSAQLKLDAHFICSDIYRLPEVLEDKFDIVFTSYGTIGWLPDLTKWAKVIQQFLKPNGCFIFVDFHPVVWMFDNDFNKVSYPYFNEKTLVEMEEGSYADRNANLHHTYHSWNHSIGEIVTALIHENLTLLHLDEIEYSPYNCFNNTIEIAPSQYKIKHLEQNIPMVLALKFENKNS